MDRGSAAEMDLDDEVLFTLLECPWPLNHSFPQAPQTTWERNTKRVWDDVEVLTVRSV